MPVASFTDAWIETSVLEYNSKRGQIRSHLLQMRGLKHITIHLLLCLVLVASFTDAWIETTLQRRV